jgi:hypothetical protein
MSLKKSKFIASSYLFTNNKTKSDLLECARIGFEDPEIYELDINDFEINPLIINEFVNFYCDITGETPETLFENNRYNNINRFFDDFCKIYEVILFYSPAEKFYIPIIRDVWDENNSLIYRINTFENQTTLSFDNETGESVEKFNLDLISTKGTIN